MRHEIPEIRLLSLDRRVRDNARELGFSLEPPAVIEAGKSLPELGSHFLDWEVTS